MRSFDRPGRSPVHATSAMAATSHPLATATALAVLREGGNAVDAAIAASATLCVVEPHMTGIGGDCFVMLCEPDGRLYGLNGSGRAPAAARLGWYVDNGFAEIAPHSPHSVTVPGAVRAWETLHARFGRMDFARLFADAVRYGREGFAVAPRVGRDWKGLEAKLRADAGARKHYLRDGHAPAVGEVMTAPALAGVLEAIARNGADAFYKGPVAADIAATVQAKGGFLSEADLAAASAEWVEPIRTRYRGLDICEIPPSGQGITALMLLNLVARVGLGDDAWSAERHFREIELARLAYAVRNAWLADPATMPVSTEALLAPAFTDRLARQFDPERRNGRIVVPPMTGSDTIYLTVVDRDLRLVSFINSVYWGFGSGIVTDRTGIALQNRGACFVVDASHPNAIDAGKRPLHTIIPAIAMDGDRPAIGFGVMGGSYQPLGQVHVLVNLLDYGMDAQEALDHPRIFWDADGALLAESGIASEVVAELAARGFDVRPGGPHGGGQIIRIDHERGVICGGSDPRKDGFAAGW